MKKMLQRYDNEISYLTMIVYIRNYKQTQLLLTRVMKYVLTIVRIYDVDR